MHSLNLVDTGIEFPDSSMDLELWHIEQHKSSAEPGAAYLHGVGFVRPCTVCKCLVADGLTTCLRCAPDVHTTVVQTTRPTPPPTKPAHTSYPLVDYSTQVPTHPSNFSAVILSAPSSGYMGEFSYRISEQPCPLCGGRTWATFYEHANGDCCEVDWDQPDRQPAIDSRSLWANLPYVDFCLGCGTGISY